MALLRASWKDTPFRMIRAARHYEAAAQIFIRKTVSQVKNVRAGSVNIITILYGSELF